MNARFRRTRANVAYAIGPRGLACAAIAMLMSSCQPAVQVLPEAQRGGKDVAPIAYSIVCVIHGDGDYLYHDADGKERNADDDALAATKAVAQNNPGAEVFVYHQKPRTHVLLFFPVHDGEFFYYRNGRLAAHESYWRDRQSGRHDAEVSLYRQFRATDSSGTVRVFVYCGHEIPEGAGRGYDASFPDLNFSIPEFADGIRGFTGPSKRFDLMVLSTCFGGTPYTIDTLGSYARYIIASPDNLHLSYFSLRGLERLDVSLRDGDVRAFAGRFARQAFEKLSGDVQTAVSVAVYDVDRAQAFMHAVRGTYDRALSVLRRDGNSPGGAEHCDCAEIPGYARAEMGEGVEVFYRPPQFGPSRGKLIHSGWECWKSPPTRDMRSGIKETAGGQPVN